MAALDGGVDLRLVGQVRRRPAATDPLGQGPGVVGRRATR